MSITMPTAFEQSHQRAGAINTMVAVFTRVVGPVDAPVYAASTTEMHLAVPFVTSLTIHATLLSVSGIKEKIDLNRKTWGTSDITLTLLNPQFTQETGGVRQRVSEGDEPALGDSILSWDHVSVYCVSGSNVTDITTDGILRFVGRIAETPTVTEKTITVKAMSIEKEKHKMLPTTLVSGTYPDAPNNNLAQRIPLVYGQFNQNFWGDIDFDENSNFGLGLAKALAAGETKNPKFVISDHVLDSIVSAFYDMGSGLLFESLDGAIDVDDSGHGTVTGGTHARQNFHLNDNVPIDYTEYLKTMAGKANVHDNNFGTKGTVLNNTTATAQVDAGRGFFGINNPSAFSDAFWVVSSGDNVTVFRVFFYNAEWTGTEAEVAGADLHDDSVFELYYGVADEHLSTTPGQLSGFRLDEESFIPLTLGDRNDATFNEAQPLAFALYIKTTPGLSLVLNTTDLLHLTEAFIEARIEIAVQPLILWIECRGREYGSWITESGRSIGGQAPGYLIENQASIIEDILRSELGVVTGDIDTDSFDDAYEEGTDIANRQARLNITDEISSETIIRRIAEQSTFAFTWTAAGKAKLIPLYSLYWSSKSIDSTIPWSHIKADSLKLSKQKVYCNEVEVSSRWHGEAGVYRDVDTTVHVGSQLAYGHWPRSARWPALAGVVATHVADRYVGTDGLWSSKHLQVEFTTLAFTNAQLEIGDAIELDSITCDPQLKAYGESWAGIKLCVTELTQTLDGTKIKAVELF